MRRLFSSFITILVIALVISTIVSFFIGEDQKTLEIDFPTVENSITPREQATWFTMSVSDTSGYNYNWLSTRLKAGDDRPEISDRMLAVNSNFYRSNNMPYVAIDMLYSGLFDPSMSMRFDALKKMTSYYESIHTQNTPGLEHFKKQSAIGIVKWFSHVPEKYYEAMTVNYADSSDRTRLAVFNQMLASHRLMNTSELEYNDILLRPGYIPEEARQYGITAFTRDQALRQVARNLFEGWRKMQKVAPENKLRILVANSSYPPPAAQIPVDACLGMNPSDLITIINELIQQNRIYGNVIPEIENRVGIAVDAAALYSVWQATDVDLFKSENKEPLAYSEFLNSLSDTFIEKNYNQVVQKRHIKAIVASYYQQANVNSKDRLKLPYSRASRPDKVLNQLKLTADLYNMSTIGVQHRQGPAYGFVILDMPRGELFPLVHRVIKPLANRYNLYLKKGAASPWEQQYSLDLLRSYLKSRAR